MKRIHALIMLSKPYGTSFKNRYFDLVRSLLILGAVSGSIYAQAINDGVTVTQPALTGNATMNPMTASIGSLGVGLVVSGPAYSYSSVFGNTAWLWGNANLAALAIGSDGAVPIHLISNGVRRLVIGPDGKVIIGADPVGSELLRVGGGARIGDQTVISGPTASLVLERSNPSNASMIRFTNAANTKYNWLIGSQYNVDNALEITPSTSIGANTYTTPAIKATPAGLVTIPGMCVVGNDPGGSEFLRVGNAGIISSGNLTCNSVFAPILYGGEKGATARQVVIGYNSLGTGTYAIQPLQQTVGYTNLSLNELGGVVTIGNFAGVTQAASTKLAVNGTITAKEIKVTTSGADYVFENDYKLRSLAEVESFIAEHKHLPEMMSAKAMQADGMPVSEVVTKQLAKIEELTLYAIAQKKETEAARAEATAARAEMNDLKNRLERLEKALVDR